jgi:hypothetical protein
MAGAQEFGYVDVSRIERRKVTSERVASTSVSYSSQNAGDGGVRAYDCDSRAGARRKSSREFRAALPYFYSGVIKGIEPGQPLQKVTFGNVH